MTGYRIQSAKENVENLLNVARADGWVAEGEKARVGGVSCCDSVDALCTYANVYSMAVQPGDLLVRVEGPVLTGIPCDAGERRIAVTSYEVMGLASDFIEEFKFQYREIVAEEEDMDEEA